jgi:hypothetical protein
MTVFKFISIVCADQWQHSFQHYHIKLICLEKAMNGNAWTLYICHPSLNLLSEFKYCALKVGLNVVASKPAMHNAQYPKDNRCDTIKGSWMTKTSPCAMSSYSHIHGHLNCRHIHQCSFSHTYIYQNTHCNNTKRNRSHLVERSWIAETTPCA